ncbi:MAG: precorrin-6Y C5,15-methyltransferase (decarboxylating) subunit CbiT [Methanophagales archaeon]|nr:precorrin-6Y C5,15-methyltransferase (decarboxylating) subunit CbiT [Methanophagales archaeon]
MSGMEQNLEAKWQYKSTGIPDNLFSRSKAGLTREEIRSIIASKARIKGNERILDVGTGSGSVSIEFALLGCDVTAVEKDTDNFEVARKNTERFGLKDKIKLIFGAMEKVDLNNRFFDVIFFGGTDNLEKSFDNVFKHLKTGGRVIIAAVRLETVVEAIGVLKDRGINPEVLNICLNKGKDLGGKTALAPSYPVFLIYGDKKNKSLTQINAD